MDRERQGRQTLISQANPQLNNNKCPVGKLDILKTYSSENIRYQSRTLVKDVTTIMMEGMGEECGYRTTQKAFSKDAFTS